MAHPARQLQDQVNERRFAFELPDPYPQHEDDPSDPSDATELPATADAFR